MAKISFRDVLDTCYSLKEAAKEEFKDDEDIDDVEGEETDEDEELDTEELPTGKGDYTADDFREIIDYVYEILDREDDDELNDSIDEIGLDLLYNVADALPQTVLNQLVDDLKEMFEIEDSLLESIISEGFVKQKKGAIAKAAKVKAHKEYKKNKSKIKLRAKKWRKSARGKKVAAMHKKLQSRLGGKKGFRLVSNLPE